MSPKEGTPSSSSSVAYHCPCQSVPTTSHLVTTTTTTSSKVYCQLCINKLLSPAIERYQKAITKRNETRNWCMDQLNEHRNDILDNNHDSHLVIYGHDDSSSSPTDSDGTCTSSNIKNNPSSTIEYYRDEIAKYNKKLHNLKEECKYKSVLTASTSVKVQDQIRQLEENKNKIHHMKLCLNNLYQSVLVSTASSNENNADDGNPTKDSNGSSGGSGSGDHSDSNGDESKEEAENSSTNNNNLATTIDSHVQHVKYQRFHLALKVFNMHRMDVGEEYNNLSFDELLLLSTVNPATTSAGSNPSNTTNLKEKKNHTQGHQGTATTRRSSNSEARLKRRIHDKQPNGIGKIGGMPLPHAGQELFGVLPNDMLSSSLRLVASMTNLLARCLGIVLPHPILLRPLLVTTFNINSGRRCGSGSEDGGACSGTNNDVSRNSKKVSSGSNVSKKSSTFASVSKKARRGIVAAVSSGTYVARSGSSSNSNNSNGKKNKGGSMDNERDDEFFNRLNEKHAALAHLQQWLNQETGDITARTASWEHILSTGKDSRNNVDNVDSNVTTVHDLEKLDMDNKRTNDNLSSDADDAPSDDMINVQKQLDQVEISSTKRGHPIESDRNINNTGISVSSSTSSLMSLVGSSSNILSRSARRAIDKMKGHNNNNGGGKYNNQGLSDMSRSNEGKGKYTSDNDDQIILIRPMDTASVTHRLRHANCAIICESSKKIQTQQLHPKANDAVGATSATPKNSRSKTASRTNLSLVQYELCPPRPSAAMDREEVIREKEQFTIGLQLLQNNIIALSIQAGVPVATLWPAEAMLLNLFSLKLFCLNQCRVFK